MEDKDLNRLLKNALSSNYEPESKLDTKIMQKARENEMRNNRKVKMSAIVVVCCILLCFSIVSFAAWQYLTPKEIAVGVGNGLLASAFESDDAIIMDESQSYGDYTVTLLGAVSGSNLTDFYSDGQLVSERTYAVIAISKTDGTPMPMTSDEDYGKVPFFVSPFIQSLNPQQFNIVTMNGGYSEIVKEGIMYRILECDNVQLFADRTLYLGVSNSNFYERSAYEYDETLGIISVNESYEGMNLLFDFPLDSHRADKAAAEQYLREFAEAESESNKMNSEEKNPEDVRQDEVNNAVLEMNQDLTVDEIIKEWTLIYEEKTEPDQDGRIHYGYKTSMGSGSGIVAEMALFETGEVGYSKSMSYDENYAVVFYRDDKGDIKVSIYERVNE
ncbi:hypothetical protein [Fusibacter sp. 3D3]|uniref:hypothetical protein n=1 Tax=Fusibacter sp. 3D3 TaxID=1048380 RepID=UPI000852E5F1|nr:hypothetical protein [Fusibacter sp. 3D3]GAU78880.1 hypothetical protein F3D3_3516 [Fusibacter sp. 3D3]